MNRGEVWLHAPRLRDGTPSLRQERVLIVSDEAVITSPYRWLHGVPVTDSDPGHVLAASTRHGWADVLELRRVYRPWLTTHIGVIDVGELDSVDARLRGALGL